MFVSFTLSCGFPWTVGTRHTSCGLSASSMITDSQLSNMSAHRTTRQEAVLINSLREYCQHLFWMLNRRCSRYGICHASWQSALSSASVTETFHVARSHRCNNSSFLIKEAGKSLFFRYFTSCSLVIHFLVEITLTPVFTPKSRTSLTLTQRDHQSRGFFTRCDGVKVGYLHNLFRSLVMVITSIEMLQAGVQQMWIARISGVGQYCTCDHIKFGEALQEH